MALTSHKRLSSLILLCNTLLYFFYSLYYLLYYPLYSTLSHSFHSTLLFLNILLLFIPLPATLLLLIFHSLSPIIFYSTLTLLYLFSSLSVYCHPSPVTLCSSIAGVAGVAGVDWVDPHEYGIKITLQIVSIILSHSYPYRTPQRQGIQLVQIIGITPLAIAQQQRHWQTWYWYQNDPGDQPHNPMIFPWLSQNSKTCNSTQYKSSESASSSPMRPLIDMILGSKWPWRWALQYYLYEMYVSGLQGHECNGTGLLEGTDYLVSPLRAQMYMGWSLFLVNIC